MNNDEKSTDYKKELEYRQALLRQFFTSKYHRLRVILFYLKRFVYLTLFFDFQGRFKDRVKIKKVINKKRSRKAKINVLYDFQIFAAQKTGGISRIFFELIDHYRKTDEVSPDLAIRYADNYYLEEKGFLADKRIINNPPPLRHISGILPTAPFLETDFWVSLTRKMMLKILSLKYIIQPGVSLRSLKPTDYYNFYEYNKQVAKQFMSKGNFDVFHPTYYDTYFLKYLNGKPFVLTIFDMIHEKYPEYHYENDIIAKQKKLLAKKARKIIAISEHVKQDIIDVMKLPADKIEVVPLASSLSRNDKNPGLKNLPKKYLLYVGTRVGYKNFVFFIKSASSVLRRQKNLSVICVGDWPASGPFTKAEKKLFSELGISKKMIYHKADDKTLTYLYSQATAFVFPTLHEGFGLPVLEAFACGCPVICSKESSVPEVAGDAALYINPRNQKSIREAILKIVNDENLRRELIAKGKERNKKYSWKKTALMTQKIYEDVLASH